MPKPLTPVGDLTFDESSWKSLKEWRKADVPPYPGVYEIRHALNGFPAPLPLASTNLVQQLGIARARKQIEEIEGVIYIGKAVCFRDRFWHLIKTWKRQGPSDPSRNHCSYETWLAKSLQSAYPVADLQFRYMSVSKEIWRPKTTDYVSELRAILMNQDGQDPDNLASARAFSEENKLLRLNIRFFAGVPPLNRMGPQQDTMTQVEMDAHLADLGKPMSALDDDDDADN